MTDTRTADVTVATLPPPDDQCPHWIQLDGTKWMCILPPDQHENPHRHLTMVDVWAVGQRVGLRNMGAGQFAEPIDETYERDWHSAVVGWTDPT